MGGFPTFDAIGPLTRPRPPPVKGGGAKALCRLLLQFFSYLCHFLGQFGLGRVLGPNFTTR